MEKSDVQDLFHVSLNPDATETIVFLHGLTSSHLEYNDVTPSLTEYHLVLVDLNGHGSSSHISPYNIQASSVNVAHLIRKHAHGGTAHVVGLSLGDFITLDLVKKYPDVVRTAFVTGAAPFEGYRKWFASRPSTIWALDTVLTKWVPESTYWWLNGLQGRLRNDALYQQVKKGRRWDVFRDGFLSVAEFGWEDVKGIRARTLVVAGEKEDDVECTKRMGPLLREQHEGSRAAVVKGAVHVWDLQFPEVFAAAIRAWIEGGDLPGELKEL